MSKFKLICLDIDGTLLNSSHQITPTTKETIRKVTEDSQIPVVLVSARMPKGIVYAAGFGGRIFSAYRGNWNPCR